MPPKGIKRDGGATSRCDRGGSLHLISSKDKGYTYGNTSLTDIKISQFQAIMTDGDRRQSAQPLGNEDVRVPLTGTSPTDVETDNGDLCSGSSGNIAMENMEPLSGSSFSAQELGAVETTSDPATEQLPYPALAPAVFFCLKQTTRPRSWCLKVVCNPYPFTPPLYPYPISTFEEPALVSRLFDDLSVLNSGFGMANKKHLCYP
ncbi:hypothetical protein chiPu_0009926 [Chiloscyllium punctatum]|uniref:Uncharacterized protein n=1 Tax=Chiloscyllium punctatum TaxID=137246 RepID=A0A401SM66_CHIPU|nr:hypothetical protein [Chiloscyllium punctatum]